MIFRKISREELEKLKEEYMVATNKYYRLAKQIIEEDEKKFLREDKKELYCD